MNEMLAVKGFVKLELLDKNGKVKKEVEKHNFISKPFKHYILKNGIAPLIEMNSRIQGQMVTYGADFKNGYGEVRRAYIRSSALANFTLNLDNPQISGITANSHFVNIWNSTMSEASKVLGYCNFNPNPLADGKEGEMQDPRPIDQVTPNVITKKFRYSDGVSTGIINAVLMAEKQIMTNPWGISGTSDIDNPGIVNFKLLDQVDIASTNFSSRSTNIIPPGVKNGTTVITEDNEIIINYSQDGKSRHKVNLTTGEITDDSSTFPFPNANYQDYIVIGDYVYYLIYNGFYICISCYQISTGNTVYTSRNIYTSEGRGNKFFYDSTNDILYVTRGSYNTTNNSYKLVTLTKSGNYFYGYGTVYNDFSTIATMPAGFNINNVLIGNYGSNYAMYFCKNRNNNTDDTGGYTVYLFTDLTDPIGSIYDCIPAVSKDKCFLFKNNSCGGILKIGNSCSDTTCQRAGEVYNTYNDGSNTYTADLRNSGCFFSTEGDWSNFVSLVILTGDDIIEKGEQDVLILTYGYEVVTT